jgi:hypothetical protein
MNDYLNSTKFFLSFVALEMGARFSYNLGKLSTTKPYLQLKIGISYRHLRNCSMWKESGFSSHKLELESWLSNLSKPYIIQQIFIRQLDLKW